MKVDQSARPDDQLLDGDEILACTFATMDMLERAVAAELGEDDGADYGLAERRAAMTIVRDESHSPPE